MSETEEEVLLFCTSLKATLAATLDKLNSRLKEAEADKEAN